MSTNPNYNVLRFHYRCISRVFDMLPIKVKAKIQTFDAMDRLKMNRIGNPSGLACVYKLNNEWVAKINVIDMQVGPDTFIIKPATRIFMMNNDYVANKLRPHMNTINAVPNRAKISVHEYREYLEETYDNAKRHVVVTFEKLIKGKSLEDFVIDNFSQNSNFNIILREILNKVKLTLNYLYGFLFNHNDLHMGNIMIDETGHPVIIDFDWSTFWNDPGQSTLQGQLREIYQSYIRYSPSDRSIMQTPYNTNCDVKYWYIVHNTYSNLGYQLGVNTPPPPINKVDLAMLLSHIFQVTQCHQTPTPTPIIDGEIENFIDVTNHLLLN